MRTSCYKHGRIGCMTRIGREKAPTYDPVTAYVPGTTPPELVRARPQPKETTEHNKERGRFAINITGVVRIVIK